MKPAKNPLKRIYGCGHLHFITCSCYRRTPLLGSAKARDLFLKVLGEVRDRYDFALIGYVVMLEHFHLLMSEPNAGDPSTVMKVLKQRVSRALRRRGKRGGAGQLRLWKEAAIARYPHFWQRRFYDFNVWSTKKKNEKLNYMHFNPVKRGLVERPTEWLWSSCRFYAKGERGLCAPNLNWEYKPAKARTFRTQNVRHPVVAAEPN
jgi:putative transposase